MRTTLLATSALLLSGCEDSPKAWSQSEIEDIAADSAFDATNGVDTSELSSRIDELEGKVSNLESELESAQAEAAALRSEISSHESLGHY
jgi:outer membrane murein-binding lipoprotein Lpp